MPSYRYLLCDLLTDQVLADLPLSGVTFERRISRTGSLAATLEAPQPGLLDSDFGTARPLGSRLVATAKLVHRNVGRCALWVYRDNELWWGGIIWTAVAKQGQRGPVSLDIQAATFDSYAHHRVLHADRFFTEVDQGVIVPSLWRTLQEDARGNIGVLAVDQPTGVLRERDYYAADQEYVGKLIEELGDLADGPEHTIDTYLDAAGARIKALKVATRIGLTEPRAVFQRTAGGGGRLLEWAHTADAVDGGTTFQVRGDASDTETSARLYNDDLLSAGWPLLDVVEDRPSTDDAAVEGEQVWALRAQRSGATRTSAYTVQVGDTGWSPNRLGDPVRLKLVDDWHLASDGADLTIRPVGVKVTATTNSSPETVELLFGDT